MGEPLKEETIGTIPEYNDLIYNIFKQWEKESGNQTRPHIWFRGQDRDEPLLPKVLRKIINPDTGIECNYNEYYIHQAFSASYGNYTSERFQDRSSEYYSFMQHYGIPTRLLDWTENGLWALYFAANGGAHDESVQRVVWVMNPGAINHLTTGRTSSYSPLLSHVPFVVLRLKIPGNFINGKFTEPFINQHIDKIAHRENEPLFYQRLRSPVAFWPVSTGNIRIAAQKGCFTIHGTDHQPLESFFDNSDIQKFLIKVKIRKESVVLLREQLRLMGATPMSVYPDLFGLATELSGPRYMK